MIFIKEKVMTQNGFLHELDAVNLDIKYHQLWSDIKVISQKLINFDGKAISFVRDKKILILFELKVFTYSFFLNKLRVDDPKKFIVFTQTCLSQLLLEMEELEFRAEESMLFKIPGHFFRDQEYLIKKIQYYMEDVERYTNTGLFPKYTFTSILEMPFDHPQEVQLKIQTIQDKGEFLKEYIVLLNLLNNRYEFTPGITTIEEIEQQKLKFAETPKGMESMNLNGVDDVLFFATTGQIITKLGEPSNHSNNKYTSGPDEFLCYHDLGIEFAFSKGSLVSICTFSGIPEGWGETRYKKYTFTSNVPFTMDATYEQIIMLYGPPLDEREFLKAKVPCVRLNYGQFEFSFNIESKRIMTFRIFSKP